MGHPVISITHRVKVAIVLFLREKLREQFNIASLHRVVERAARKEQRIKHGKPQ
jgi:hypothetical protein